MDSAKQHRYQTALALADSPFPVSSADVTSSCSSSDMRNESEDPNASEIMTLLHSGADVDGECPTKERLNPLQTLLC